MQKGKVDPQIKIRGLLIRTVLFFFSKDDTSNLVKKLSSEVQSTIKWNNPLILNLTTY